MPGLTRRSALLVGWLLLALMGSSLAWAEGASCRVSAFSLHKSNDQDPAYVVPYLQIRDTINVTYNLMGFAPNTIVYCA